MTLEQMIVMGVALAILLFRALDAERARAAARGAPRGPARGRRDSLAAPAGRAPAADRGAAPPHADVPAPEPPAGGSAVRRSQRHERAAQRQRRRAHATREPARRVTGGPRARPRRRRSARAARDPGPGRTAAGRCRRRSRARRASPGPASRRIAVTSRSSVIATPRKPSRPRSSVVVMRRESSATRRRRAPGSARCSSSRGAPRRGSPAANGTSSARRSVARESPTVWISASSSRLTAPSPGKCLSVAATPPCCRPRANAVAERRDGGGPAGERAAGARLVAAGAAEVDDRREVHVHPGAAQVRGGQPPLAAHVGRAAAPHLRRRPGRRARAAARRARPPGRSSSAAAAPSGRARALQAAHLRGERAARGDVAA